MRCCCAAAGIATNAAAAKPMASGEQSNCCVMTKPPCCPARLASFGYARQLNTAWDDWEMGRGRPCTAARKGLSSAGAAARIERNPEGPRRAGDTIPHYTPCGAAELPQEIAFR